MNTIRKLWRGEISPRERRLPHDSPIKSLSERMSQERDKFMEELSEDGKSHFEAYDELSLQISSICEEDSFIEGFRLGARIILDVLLAE